MKKFKIFLMLITFAFLLTSCGNSAVVPPDECFETDGNTITKYNFDNDKCGTNIIIPEKIRGTEIKEIGKYAFTEEEYWYFILQMTAEYIGWERQAEKLIESEEKEDADKLLSLYKEAQKNIIKDKNKNKKMLQGVQFPDTIEKIWKGAFMAQDLNFVSFWANLQEIHDRAFMANTITKVNFSKVQNPIEIYRWAFLLNYFNNIEIPKWSEVEKHSFISNVEIIYK